MAKMAILCNFCPFLSIFGILWLFLVSVFPVYISGVILAIWGLTNVHFGSFLAILGHLWLFLASVFPVYISGVILTILGLTNGHFGPFLAIAFMGLICEGWLQHSASISLYIITLKYCTFSNVSNERGICLHKI